MNIFDTEKATALLEYEHAMYNEQAHFASYSLKKTGQNHTLTTCHSIGVFTAREKTAEKRIYTS
jgi:hypothetical protein